MTKAGCHDVEWTGTQSFRWYGCSDIQQVCFPALGFEVKVKNDIDGIDTKPVHSILGIVHMRKTHLLLQRTLAKGLNLPQSAPLLHTQLYSGVIWNHTSFSVSFFSLAALFLLSMAKIKSLVLHLTTAQCFDHGDEISTCNHPKVKGK